MPTTVTSIDPVTRLEGHLKIEVTIASDSGSQKVVDAKATGTMFRGLENILVGRPPDDAPDITQRICGFQWIASRMPRAAEGVITS